MRQIYNVLCVLRDKFAWKWLLEGCVSLIQGCVKPLYQNDQKL